MSEDRSFARARAPAAFRLDDAAVSTTPDDALDRLEPEAGTALEAVEEIVHPPRRGIRWGRLALAAGGALVSLAVGVAVDDLIRSLFLRADWLGWLGLGLTVLFLLALLVLVGREVVGLLRLKQVARLRLDAEAAAAGTSQEAARTVAHELMALYSARPDTAMGRRQLAGHLREIIDAPDLLRLAERHVVLPLDDRARGLVSASARRVSVVTALSPRALIDVAFVLWESLRLVRRLATLYGGRPGTLGLIRLVRAVVGHLAVTGTLSVGDTVLQQLVGHGIAGRLSARFGEGVVNGLMTARIGLAAMDVCRPLPFLHAERPRLKDLAGDLVSFRDERALTGEPPVTKR